MIIPPDLLNEMFVNEIDSSFSYNFSIQEAKDLVLLLRKHEKELPNSLIDFSISLQQHVYNSMTIDEAENFFYESI
ncbi:MAG: hypothetical protein UIH41_06495 [Treponemataceae bacterium]|nr:hypothetical protein [Treponemataceae bacterium]